MDNILKQAKMTYNVIDKSREDETTVNICLKVLGKVQCPLTNKPHHGLCQYDLGEKFLPYPKCGGWYNLESKRKSRLESLAFLSIREKIKSVHLNQPPPLPPL